VSATVLGWARCVLPVILLLRLGLVGLTLRDPTGGILLDSEDYLALSSQLAAGSYLDPTGAAHDLTRPPGYPLYLAATYGPGGGAWLAVLGQLALTSGMAWMVYRVVASRATQRAGLMAGWLIAVSPNMMLWSTTIMTEALFTVLVVASALVLWPLLEAQGRPWRWAAAGVLLAAATYVRPVGMILLPAWAGVVGWQRYRRFGPRVALQGAGGLTLVVVFLVAPWYARNQMEHNRLTFSDVSYKTMTGFNLAETLSDALHINRNDAIQLLQPGASLSELAVDVITKYPRSFLKVQAFGIARTIAGTDIGTWGNVLNWDTWTGFGLLSGLFERGIDYGNSPLSGARSPLEVALHRFLLATSLVYSLVLMLAAAAGLWGIVRGRAGSGFAWLALVTVVLLTISPGAAGQARFRVPAEPFLAMLPAVVVVDKLGIRRTSLQPALSRAAVEIEDV